MKTYKAIIMTTDAVDELIRTELDIKGKVTRYGDTLSYQVRGENADEMEKFQIRMAGRATHWHDTSDVPESTAKELLENRLGICIYRLFVSGYDQIILINDET